MIVYIVMQGDRYEGTDVVCATLSEETALAKLKKIAECIKVNHWDPDSAIIKWSEDCTFAGIGDEIVYIKEWELI